MNRVIEALQAGLVTTHRGHGQSMRPVIHSGQQQTLVPVLSAGRARELGCIPFRRELPYRAGDKLYLTPEELREGDAVYCKVGGYVYTHEIIGIRGKPGNLEFLIARHDRKRINGWTSSVYGKCVLVSD